MGIERPISAERRVLMKVVPLRAAQSQALTEALALDRTAVLG